MGKSLAEQVALLPDAERERILGGFDPEALMWDWSFWGRPEQIPPSDGSWDIWLYSAGRGSGKTRSAAEWVREAAREPGLRLGLVARTSADVRDVMIEGDSGILAVSPPSERPEWQPSKRKLTWPNGTYALAFTADEPDQLRGPQFHAAWADEIAAWRQVPDAMGLTAWDNLRIATRLGDNPRIVATTTPKKVPVFRGLLNEAAEPDSRVILSRGSTRDNAGNLSQVYLDAIYGIYAGTSLAQQELEGELLDSVEGALWTEETIEAARVGGAGQWRLGLIAVDPTVAERPGDECGIVVVLASGERELFRRHVWVVEDATVHGSPTVWASRVVEVARRWGLPVVAEVNQGGALVRSAIHAIDPGIPVVEVVSRVGKGIRAEPVSLAYEQGRVHHVGVLPELETQMTTWVPGEGRSPDRCVVQGTRVLMGDGISEKPIETVSVGDLVMTRAGARKVLAACETGRVARSALHEITANGRVLRATGNHPVWFENVKNFVELADIDALVHDTILVWNSRTQQAVPYKLNGKEWSSSASLMPRNAHTKSTTQPHAALAGQTGAVSTAYTAKSIALPMARLGRDYLSTTTTTTRSTTRLTTWWQSPDTNTLRHILKSLRHPASAGAKLSYRQPLLKKETTLSWPAPVRARQQLAAGLTESQSLLRALHADSSFKHETRVLGSAAAVNAAALYELLSERQRLSTGNVPCAVSSSSASQEKLMSARCDAQVSVGGSGAANLSVAKDGLPSTLGDSASSAGRSTSCALEQQASAVAGFAVDDCRPNVDSSGPVPVWNLTVEGENEYFAEGILTHNCDALVHGITGLLITPPKGFAGGKLTARVPKGRLPLRSGRRRL